MNNRPEYNIDAVVREYGIALIYRSSGHEVELYTQLAGGEYDRGVWLKVPDSVPISEQEGFLKQLREDVLKWGKQKDWRLLLVDPPKENERSSESFETFVREMLAEAGKETSWNVKGLGDKVILTPKRRWWKSLLRLLGINKKR